MPSVSPAMSIADLIKTTCGRSDCTPENAPELFINCLLEVLLRSSDVIPKKRENISSVINFLTKIGLDYSACTQLPSPCDKAEVVNRIQFIDKRLYDFCALQQKLWSIYSMPSVTEEDPCPLPVVNGITQSRGFVPDIMRTAISYQSVEIKSENIDPDVHRVLVSGDEGLSQPSSDLFELPSKTVKLHLLKEIEGNILCCDINKHRIAIGNDKGLVYLIQEDSLAITTIQAHQAGVTCVCLDKQLLYTGGGDKQVLLFAPHRSVNSKANVTLESAIEAIDIRMGVLYIATQSRKVYEADASSLLLARDGVPFATSPIKQIKALELFGRPVLAVVEENKKAICIRDCYSGDLVASVSPTWPSLETVRLSDTCPHIIFTGVSSDCIVVESSSEDKPYCVPLSNMSSFTACDGYLFVAENSNTILIHQYSKRKFIAALMVPWAPDKMFSRESTAVLCTPGKGVLLLRVSKM